MSRFAVAFGCLGFVLIDGTAIATIVLHVDKNSTAVNPNGLSWPEAFPELRDALASLDPGDPLPDTEIWVAAGTYNPGGGSVVHGCLSSAQLLRRGLPGIRSDILASQPSRDLRWILGVRIVA